MRIALAVVVLGWLGTVSAVEEAVTASTLERLQQQRAFQAVRQFADVMVTSGRDDYGPRKSPLFAGQLNVDTRRLPAGTAEDPGLLAGNPEVAGCQPACQNLLFDLGLLDVLGLLSTLTGDRQYEAARRDCLAYYFANCRDPRSGYFPWGEHVGYDLVKDAVTQGTYKGMHEVKGMRVPWDLFWEIDPQATRHEIEVALYNHVCDTRSFAFNRHANLDGTPNQGSGPCSLACSAGLYLQAWSWLGHKTGEAKFSEWAGALNRLYWDRRSPTTGLFPTSEDRPQELWYSDVLIYACFLLAAAEDLGPEGSAFREQALAYVKAFHRAAYDEAGPGIYDTLDTETGKPVVGTSSRHYPDIRRPKYLTAWGRPANSGTLCGVATTTAIAYDATGDEDLRRAFDRTYALLDLPAHIRQGTAMVAGDAAGLLAGLVHVARRSGETEYLERAGLLADHLLAVSFRNGLFTSGLPGTPEYYAARLGSNNLAAALLGYAVSVAGRPDLVPPIRDQWGALSW